MPEEDNIVLDIDNFDVERLRCVTFVEDQT
jgi:hypothetical protein